MKNTKIDVFVPPGVQMKLSARLETIRAKRRPVLLPKSHRFGSCEIIAPKTKSKVLMPKWKKSWLHP